MTENLSIEILRAFLRIDPHEGRLFWKERDVSFFIEGAHSAEHSQRIWNSQHAGKEAFLSLDKKGYRYGRINKRPLYAHRVIWAHFHGMWPDNLIDHRNRNKLDNRIGNLRPATRAENTQNSIRATQAAVYKGVHLARKTGRWKARIKANCRVINLGSFATPEEAAQAYNAAAVREHGEFACLNKIGGEA